MWKLEQRIHAGTSKHLSTQAQGRDAQGVLHTAQIKLATGRASLTSCVQTHSITTKVAQTMSCCQEHHSN